MKLSTRTRYGLRATIELAKRYPNGIMQMREISRTQEISLKYLEHLMSILKSGGIVKSVRGVKGGFTLVKHPNQVKLREIFTCLEGAVATTECTGDESICARSADCAARDVWVKVQKAIDDVLESITLEDLAERSLKSGNLQYQI